jgi:hypothetical protein
MRSGARRTGRTKRYPEVCPLPDTRAGTAGGRARAATAGTWTHSSHDPASWKYHHLGNFMRNDVIPPTTGSYS